MSLITSRFWLRHRYGHGPNPSLPVHGLRAALHVCEGHVAPIGAVQPSEIIQAVADIQAVDGPRTAE